MEKSSLVNLRLRPLSFGELLSESYEFYREHFPPLFAICFIGMLPTAAAGIGAYWLVWSVGQTSAPNSDIAIMLFTYATSIVAALVMTVGCAAVTKAAAGFYEGKVVSIGEAYGFVLRRIVPFFLTLFLLFFLCMMALPFCCVPALAVWVFFCALWKPIFVVENRRFIGLIERNLRLVRAHWPVVLGVTLVLYLMQNVLNPILTMPAFIIQIIGFGMAATEQAPAWLQALVVFSYLWSTVIHALLVGYLTICPLLLYYDLRVREEALDVELLTTGLEWQVQEIMRGRET